MPQSPAPPVPRPPIQGCSHTQKPNVSHPAPLQQSQRGLPSADSVSHACTQTQAGRATPHLPGLHSQHHHGNQELLREMQCPLLHTGDLTCKDLNVILCARQVGDSLRAVGLGVPTLRSLWGAGLGSSFVERRKTSTAVHLLVPLVVSHQSCRKGPPSPCKVPCPGLGIGSQIGLSE